LCLGVAVALTIRQRFGIERVILVSDRAIITDAHATTLKELGAGFVSALKTAQIRKLMKTGDLQLSLFDERNLAEIASGEFPGERLVVCRNPHLAQERARKREDLPQATERELDKVRQMVEGPRGPLREAHFFLFLLAYHILSKLQARLAPMLYTDDTPLMPADPVASAQRSTATKTKDIKLAA
jgi:hypothetical protein